MPSDVQTAIDATKAVPSIPRDADGPVFREPWEAQAFAMALVLHERGLFTWSEWAATLADELKAAAVATLEEADRIHDEGGRDARGGVGCDQCRGGAP